MKATVGAAGRVLLMLSLLLEPQSAHGLPNMTDEGLEAIS
jgi:hypothetical protein